LSDAGKDLTDSLKGWRLWVSLALHDIAARYRGSLLGPFWITATTAAFVIGVGLLYSQIFGQDAKSYVPWLAVGIVFWTYIATVLVEGCDALMASSGIIRQTSLPMLTFLFRVHMRNVIVLAHQIIIIAVVLLWLTSWTHSNILLGLIGLVLSTLNLFWMTVILSIVSARFRDVPQIVTAVVQLLLFLTPVFWRPESVHQNRFLFDYNPLFHMLEVIRRPLLGEAAQPTSYITLLVTLVLGWAAMMLLFAQTRRRVVHFL
jgi:ABC-type polysaccharide/polyol phosphate export permease